MRRNTNALAADGHTITVKDLRPRFGAPEVFAPSCSCGWRGEEHRGRTAERTAKRDGAIHVDQYRLTHTARAPSAE
jgi:hypothetical protein